MHLVFEALMNLQLVGWTMIAGLLLFSGPAMVERFFFWLVIHSQGKSCWRSTRIM